MLQSAGTLLYRFSPMGWAVLLVHPSGNYNRRAPWSIPKGLPDEGEELEAAARRETLEETGVAAGPLVPLGHVDYRKSRKRIHAFAGEVDLMVEPAPSSWEVDKAEFVPLEVAFEWIHPDQREFLERLVEIVKGQSG